MGSSCPVPPPECQGPAEAPPRVPAPVGVRRVPPAEGRWLPGLPVPRRRERGLAAAAAPPRRARVGGAGPVGPARRGPASRSGRAVSLLPALRRGGGRPWRRPRRVERAVGPGALGGGAGTGTGTGLTSLSPFSPQRRRPGSGCCEPSRRRWVRDRGGPRPRLPPPPPLGSLWRLGDPPRPAVMGV